MAAMRHQPYDPNHYAFQRRLTAPPPTTIDPPRRWRVHWLWVVNVLMAIVLLLFVWR